MEADRVTARTGSGEKMKRRMRRDAQRSCQWPNGKNDKITLLFSFQILFCHNKLKKEE